ncbi:hypothetical protein E3N88_35463 [Mikania micrantha]|uniref:Thioredoxin domain-containing protein n=1 Tax=Mikania micrantha TaxID=192012 RepID=A0A5N6M3T6_9ASTR|nr:hypothetical protein E3N88_35463 [Mikania micrantha]
MTFLLFKSAVVYNIFSPPQGQNNYKLELALSFFLDHDDGDESNHQAEFTGGNVTLVTTKDVWDQKLAEAKREHKIVVANFSAGWCGPCRMISPYYIELSVNHPALMFLTVDVDELSELSTQWDIKATPTFFFLRDGEQMDRLVGANKPELLRKIKAIVESETSTTPAPRPDM